MRLRTTMIGTLLLLPMFFLLGTMDVAAQTPRVDGTWEISWETRLGQTRSFTVNLEREGAMVDGTAEIPNAFFMENGESGTSEMEISDGDTHGTMVTFKIETMHPHHEIMRRPETDQSMMGNHGTMGHHTIALYAAVDDTEMEGYLTGVMSDPATAVPFEATKLY